MLREGGWLFPLALAGFSLSEHTALFYFISTVFLDTG